MRARRLLVVALLLAGTCTFLPPSVSASAQFVYVGINKSSVALDTYQGPSTDTVQVTVRNDYLAPGSHSTLSVTSAGSWSVTGLTLTCTSGSGGCLPSIAPNNTATLTYTVSASSAAVSGTYAASWTISSNFGSVQTATVSVVVRTDGVLGAVSVGSVVKQLDCGARSQVQYATFTISYPNTGDYSITVYSTSFSISSAAAVTFSAVDGSSFSIGGKSTVTRSFQARISAESAEISTTFTASVSTNRNSGTASSSIQVTHPVNFVAPDQRSHDFGEAALLIPTTPWTVRLQETCGYKSVALSADPPTTTIVGLDATTFATLQPATGLSVPAGGSLVLSLSATFRSRHNDFLLKNVSWSQTIRPTGQSPITFTLLAVPTFVNADQARGALQAAVAQAEDPALRAVAEGYLALLEERIVHHRPTTPEAAQDAGQLVALAEPAARLVDLLGLALEGIEAQEFDEATNALATSALLTAPLKAFCEGVGAADDRARCLDLLGLLAARLKTLADEAIEHYSDVQSTGGTVLELEQAAKRLGRVQEALGEEAAAKAAFELAGSHFREFNRLENETDAHLDRIQESLDRRSPLGFLQSGRRLIIWQPFGYVSFRAHERIGNQEYGESLARLQEAGDTFRAQAVEAELGSFRDDIHASTPWNVLILALYLALSFAVGAAAVWNALRLYDLRSRVRKGSLLLR